MTRSMASMRLAHRRPDILPTVQANDTLQNEDNREKSDLHEGKNAYSYMALW